MFCFGPRFSAFFRHHEGSPTVRGITDVGALLALRSHLGMKKLSALRVLSIGVLTACSAGGGIALAAEVSAETSSSGATTTYFPPSNDSAATAPTPSAADSDKATTDSVNADKEAQDKAAADKAASDKQTSDKATADKDATDKATAEKAATEKTSEPSPSDSPASAAAATPAAESPPATTPSTAAIAPPAATPPAATESAAQPDAKPETPAPPPAATAEASAPIPVSPIVEGARKKLADKGLIGKDNLASDVAAAADFYNAHKEPLWIQHGAFNEKAKAVISELQNADDWGLESSDFIIPKLGQGSEAEGAAEAQLTLSALKYARFARGGRLDPVALSNILDMKPPVKDPKVVMRELAEAAHPGAFLRGMNPHHEGFERLRQALLKARGKAEAKVEEEEKIDPAELVKIPAGRLIRPGAKNSQVALLRQRLKVPASDPADEQVYDDTLVSAVRDYQRNNGLPPDGIVGSRVRAALNSAGKPPKIDNNRNIDRLIANMERWRWLPENLGSFYVMNNIPEFVSEIYKDNHRVLRQKIVVGMPAWPTPVLKASMQYVIFHPSWGMPDGIKAKELAPRLRQASNSGFDFFDQLFGGGSGGSGGARVIKAYKLQVYYNGHQIDPNSVNWNTADISRYSFTQPPGADNPLGLVKFRFPNKHDVYMHDTPEKGAFSRTNRALSHGCMRVEEPRKTAEVILQEDKGYSPEKVGELWNSGASVTLSKQVPVYLVYFTARVEDDGHLATFADLYGNDNRVMSALRGHPVRYNAPEAIDPTEADQPGASGDYVSDAGSDDLNDDGPAIRRNRSARATASRAKYKSPPSTLQDALSSIFLN
jgi:murein L,D-transpeptidase YcbB/YkuD